MNLCDLVPFEMVALKIGTRYPTTRSQLPFSKQFLYVKMKEDYKFLFFFNVENDKSKFNALIIL